MTTKKITTLLLSSFLVTSLLLGSYFESNAKNTTSSLENTISDYNKNHKIVLYKDYLEWRYKIANGIYTLRIY